MLDGDTGKIDGEHAECSEMFVGNYKAYLFVYEKSEYTIHWNDGEYAYSIMSDILDFYDLIAIAESVK